MDYPAFFVACLTFIGERRRIEDLEVTVEGMVKERLLYLMRREDWT